MVTAHKEAQEEAESVDEQDVNEGGPSCAQARPPPAKKYKPKGKTNPLRPSKVKGKSKVPQTPVTSDEEEDDFPDPLEDEDDDEDEENVEQGGDDDDYDEGDEAASQATQSQSKKRKEYVHLDEDVEEALVEWIKEHPEFYDRSRSDYRKIKDKKQLWKDKAESMGLTYDQLFTWYESLRTRFGRLTKAGKSGDGAKKFTEREEWILRVFDFLKVHIKRHVGRQPCSVSKN